MNQLIVDLISFEVLKCINEYVVEYWSVCDFVLLFGYSQWWWFEDVIWWVMVLCVELGNEMGYYFVGVGKMVELGLGSVCEFDDYYLLCFVCYLIVQNGDLCKLVIVQVQKYFVIQI